MYSLICSSHTIIAIIVNIVIVILTVTGQVQSLVTALPLCDEDTDDTSDDWEEEIIQEFGWPATPPVSHHTLQESGRLMEKCVYLTVC